jgi:Ca2+/Na+ antiporter
MANRSGPTFNSYLPVCLFMFIVGWGGVAWLVFFTLPAVWQRWGFFLLLTVALTATALPATYFLNLRFPSRPPANQSVILRQAIWLGVYGSTLAWLQLDGFVSAWTFVGLGFGLCVIEYLIRLRERSRWQPSITEEEQPLTPKG